MANKTNESKEKKASSGNSPKKTVGNSQAKPSDKKNVKKPQPAPPTSAKAKQAAFERQRQLEKQRQRELIAVLFFLKMKKIYKLNNIRLLRRI